MSTIPEGNYIAHPVSGSIQFGETENHNPQVALNLHLVRQVDRFGEDAQVIDECDFTCTTFLVFTDKSEKYATDRLKAAGYSDETKDVDETIEVPVTVKYREYEGKEKMDVQIFTGGGTVQLKKLMDAKSARGFQAKLAKLMGGKSAASSAAPKAAPSAPAKKDEEVPF